MIPADFETNREVRFTPAQRRFLLSWMTVHVGINGVLLIALSVAITMRSIVAGCALLASVVIYIGIIAYQYLTDLFVAEPDYVMGIVVKNRRRVRGPTHYVLLIDDKQLRCPKPIWDQIKDGAKIEVYFAAKTKWVLSYREEIDL